MNDKEIVDKLLLTKGIVKVGLISLLTPLEIVLYSTLMDESGGI